MPELKIDLSHLTDDQRKSLQSIRDIQAQYKQDARIMYAQALVLKCGVSGELCPLSEFVHDGRIFIKDGMPVCKQAMSLEYMNVDELIGAYIGSLGV
jgi:hypothetical protein